MLGQGCLAARGAGRGLAGRWWVSLAGGGGGGVGRCAAPPRGLGQGALGAGGGKVALLRSVSPPPPGRAPRRVASSLPRLPHCIGSRPHAAVPLRPMGFRRAPAEGCRSAAGTAGVGGRMTGGTRRTAARAAAVAPLLGCRGPPGGGGGGGVSPRARLGGAGPPSPWPASRCPRAGGGRGGGGGGGRGGGSPQSLSRPLVPLTGGCGGAPWSSRPRGASR